MDGLEILAIVVFVFASLRFLVVLVNFLSFKNLDEADEVHGKSIAVLIPARNEAENISRILDDLLKQTLTDFQVFVYDDQSEDKTVDVIRDFQKMSAGFHLIRGGELPKGWGGKSHACHQLSQHTNADILVFLDADVRISKTFLQKIASHYERNKLDLLSIFPIQITSTYGEKIVVPLFNWILLTLLPLRLVRKSSWTSFSAANGQCMVFDGKNYRKYQWHEIVRNEVVEDIGIMKAMKKKKCKVETLIGQHEISCRMYHTFKASFNGVARSAPAFFGNNLLWALFYLLMVLVGPFAILFLLNYWYLAVYALFVVFVRFIVSILSRANGWQMILWHIPQMLVLPFIVIKGFIMRLRKRYNWKNREINL